MPVYKPGTPEARLADLLDLAEHAARVFAMKPSMVLQDAIEAAEAKIAEQIRAVAAELGTAPAAPEPRRPFKVGDRVRVISNVDRNVEGWEEAPLGEGRIVNHDESSPPHMCWDVRLDGNDALRRSHYHSERELEHVDA